MESLHYQSTPVRLYGTNSKPFSFTLESYQMQETCVQIKTLEFSYK